MQLLEILNTKELETFIIASIEILKPQKIEVWYR